MSESDHLNSTNNTGNTFISLDQASTIMADQTQGGNPLHVIANAGVLDPIGPIENTSVDQWKQLYDINVF